MIENGKLNEENNKVQLSPQQDDVIILQLAHRDTWRDKPETYWFCRLIEEVGELGAALVGDHKDSPEWELKQIATICINWLEYRAALDSVREPKEDG